MPVIPPQLLPPYDLPSQDCDCPGTPSLPFVPKFESLSDNDLDVCEIIALSILAGAPDITWNSLQFAFTLTDCCRCLSPRARRELEVWWVLYISGCTTVEQMREILRIINSKTTLDQRKGTLSCLRAMVWDYAQCSDLR